MRTRRRLAIACGAGLLLTAPLHAQKREYLLELGAGGVVTSFADVTDLDTGFGAGFWFGVWLPANLGLELEGATSSAKTAAGSTTDVLSGTASLLYNIRSGESSSFFLKGGMGTTRYGDCPDVSVPGSGPCGTASAIVFGGGARLALSPVVMVRAGLDYQRNSDATSFSNLLGNFGVSVMLASRPMLDTDRDGVLDRKDKCPATPEGAIVNKRGCPSDTDGDSVPDGLDRCPATPAGATVDAAGCPSDSDSDGVPDGVDQCAATPAGAQVGATGCEVDTDLDGVPDGLDRCPATPQGATVDALGCPSDGDGDKVPDGVDQCPASPPGSGVNEVGCPEEVKPAAHGVGPWTVPGTAFAPLASTIGGSALPVLDSVLAVLRAYPGTTLEIVGHADEGATPAANLQLAADRADAVRNYLLRSGVRPAQLQASGEGPSGAAPPNAPEGNPWNRRVDIRLASPPPAP